MSADSIMSRVIDPGDGVRYVPYWNKRYNRFITGKALSMLDRYDQGSNIFRIAFARTLDELRGTFGRGELSLILDTANATGLGPYEVLGITVILRISDGIDLDGLDTKWDVSKQALISKLQALPVFSLMCLEIWAYKYWYSNPENIGFDSWVEDLTTG
jgi:hypothetical protein